MRLIFPSPKSQNILKLYEARKENITMQKGQKSRTPLTMQIYTLPESMQSAKATS
jgi:hypothetical protein